jgi:hypothetical protein
VTSPKQKHASGQYLLFDAWIDRERFVQLANHRSWTAGPIEFDVRASEKGPHLARGVLDWEERADSRTPAVSEILYEGGLRWSRQLGNAEAVHLDTDAGLVTLVFGGLEILLASPAVLADDEDCPAMVIAHLAEALPVGARVENGLSSALEEAAPRRALFDLMDRLLAEDGVRLTRPAHSAAARVQPGSIYPVLFAEFSDEVLVDHPSRLHLSASDTTMVLAREHARGGAFDHGGTGGAAWESRAVSAQANTVSFRSMIVTVLTKAAIVVLRSDVAHFPAGRLYSSTLWADALMLARLERLILATFGDSTKRLAASRADIEPERAAKLQRSLLAFKTSYARVRALEQSAGGRVLALAEDEFGNATTFADVSEDTEQIVSIAALQTDGEERSFATFATIFASVLLPAQLTPQVLEWLGIVDGARSVWITAVVTVASIFLVFTVRRLVRVSGRRRRARRLT